MDMASGNNLCSGNIGHMLPKGHRRLAPIFSHLLVLWINISNCFPRKTYMRYIPANATFAITGVARNFFFGGPSSVSYIGWQKYGMQNMVAFLVEVK